ncbi:MAG: penicillin-binding transpeptidase domain-containing protein [Desulfarculaceae bacterium]|jgi:peptidoglycan glycosyltransferase
MSNLRLAVAAFWLVAAFLAIGGRVYWLQMDSRDQVLAKSYLDRKTLKTLNQLRQEGVFKGSPDGQVVVDERLLRLKIRNPAQRNRIKKIVSRARIYPGQREFDYRLLRISRSVPVNTRDILLRGRICDRAGITLAQNVIDPRTGAQKRDYPLGPLTQQILGFKHPVFGTRGLEAALDSILYRPDPTRLRPTYNLAQAKVRSGTDVYLTIDSKLQSKIAQIMGHRKGAAVILKASTGALLAAVGNPCFDPNQKSYVAWYQARTEKRGRLLRSKVWETLYPPGSTFKLVTAATWLEAHSAQPIPKLRQFCTGRDVGLNISDLKPHGWVGLDEALIRSCNVYFARLSQILGPKICQVAERFGFNGPLDLIPQIKNLRLPAETSLAYARYQYHEKETPRGRIRVRQISKFKTYKRDFKLAAQGAIGQNLIWVTPLQMAMVAQAISNHGFLLPPHIIKGIGNAQHPADFKVVMPGEGRWVLSPKTSERLHNLMVRVMKEGTGRHAPPITRNQITIDVAGKTGSAETGREGEMPHAWFVGFAPADAPQFVIALVLEQGGLGGRVAAPLAVEMLAAALNAQTDNHRQTTLIAQRN